MFDHHQGNFFPLILNWSNSACVHCFLSSPCAPLHGALFHLPYALLLGCFRQQKALTCSCLPQAVQAQLSQLLVYLVFHTAASQLSCFTVSVPGLSWEDQSWTIAPDAVSQMPGRGKLPGPSICPQCFS